LKKLLSTAFARAVSVESTLAYMGNLMTFSMGNLMTFLAKGSEASGCFALMEFHTQSGNEPPPHVHEQEHELYFVLEGTMRVKYRTLAPARSSSFPRARPMHSSARLMSYAR
jgi:mannose-6-phosphate isomerase-like protein (cupin superfamily)